MHYSPYINKNSNKHSWIIDKNTNIQTLGGISELICSNCNILAWQENNEIYIYSYINGFSNNEDIENITCEEFIIKSIIE